MSSISKYVGTDPNNHTSTMAKVTVTTAGFLNLATIPTNDKYIMHFWVKSTGSYNCQLLQENTSLLDFTTTTSWVEKEIKFTGVQGSPILFYLPVGTYYFWHSKLESGTLTTDYSQAQDDFEELVSESSTYFQSQIKQLSDSIVLAVDGNGNVVQVALGADRNTGNTFFKVGADNISLEGKTIDLTSDNIKIESNNFSVDENGSVVARDLELTGGSIQIGQNFSVDENGNMTSSALTNETNRARNAEESLGTQISTSADEVSTTIARASYTFNESAFNGTIHYYGYGNPEPLYPASATYAGKNYLDQNEGKVYSCFTFTTQGTTTYGWNVVQELDYISDTLSSRIEQTATGISFSLTKSGEDTAVLSMNYTKEDGTVVQLLAQSIQFSGLVEFSDLSGNGTTTINGANITTGYINCDRLNGGTINGQDISGGTISGAAIIGAIYLRNAFGDTPVLYVDDEGTVTPVCLVIDGRAFGEGTKVYGKLQLADNALYLSARGVSGLYSPHILNYLVREYEVNFTFYNAFGNSSQGTRIYGSSIWANHSIDTSSDERLKENYKTLDELEEAFYSLEPCSYTFKLDDEKIRHVGFKAQQVEKAINDSGLKSDEFSFVNLNDAEDEMKEYIQDGILHTLRYDEFMALNTHIIQKQHNEINNLKEELATLKEQVAFLLKGK